MKLFKKIIIPILMFLGIAVGAYLIFDKMSNGDSVLYYVLIADILCTLYYFSYQLTKKKKSKIYYLYLTSIVFIYFLFTVITSLLAANSSISISGFRLLYFIVIGLLGLAIMGLNLLYGGLNDSIRNQNRGKHNLAKMKQICEEILHILKQKGKDTEEAVKEIEMVIEALEYSDPVSHKSVYSIERKILNELQDALGASKHRLVGKVNKVLKDIDEVMYLIKKRNTILKDIK